MIKIEVMPIEQLLRIPNLYNRDYTTIIFITTNPGYYDFGGTLFIQLNIADTDAPVISKQDIIRLRNSISWMKHDTIYVCCDAGLSRSPAVARFLAVKLGEFHQAEEIIKKYRFLNITLYYKLMDVI